MVFTEALRRRNRRARQDDGLSSTSSGTVWLINQYANSTDLPGITRHVELAQQLIRIGWQPRIFASGFHHNTATYRRSVRPYRLVIDDVSDGVHFSWVYSTPYRSNGWKRYLNMLTFMLSLIVIGVRQNKPDVIIGSSPHLLTGLGGWILARRYRVPFIFEVRDMWPDMLVQLGLRNRMVIGPLTATERLLYGQSDRIIALTDGIAERIGEKGVSDTKIEVVPNATLRPASLDEAERKRMRRALGWDGKVVVVWAGSHNPMNGLDVVVDAARILQDSGEMIFAFIGDGSLKADLMHQARDLPFVKFYEPLAKTEIGAWLRAADIGLLHSRKFEVFTGARPNKLFDYMAAGLPMVSTVPGEAWRLIDDAGAGIAAEWEDPKALANAISILVGDRALREAMGQRAFRAVCDVHSREATASHLARLLADVRATYQDRPKASRETHPYWTGDQNSVTQSRDQMIVPSKARSHFGDRDAQPAD